MLINFNKSDREECRWSLTEHGQDFVQHVVQGPDVGGPVGMTEAPFEGEESGQDLRQLALKPQHILFMSLTRKVIVVVVTNYSYLIPNPELFVFEEEEDSTHHSDKRADGQDTDRHYDAAQSQQTQQTETAPPDRTVCTNTWKIFI